jgi:peptidoglycan/xylan/chitin deacetylase (PgdA/CDA1 family)
MLSKIMDLLKDRRGPFWAFHQAKKLKSERISFKRGLGENLLFSLTVDVEHDFGVPQRLGSFTSVGNGLSNLMKFFENQNVTATFFVQKTVCTKFPKYLKKMSSTHEVGLHGYAHECWGKQKWWLKDNRLPTMKEKRRYLSESIDAVKRATFNTPKSFRAPYLVIDMDSLRLLDEFGFEVDSSAPPYYGIPPKPYHPDDLSLLEIPVSADPRPKPDLLPIPHFRFDYLNTKLLAVRGVDWCANFVRNVLSYQIERDIKPHIVMLTHQWEFAGFRKVPNKSFDYAMVNNEKLLHEFFSVLRRDFKVKFLPMNKLAKVVI